MDNLELSRDAAALPALIAAVKQITDRQAIREALQTYCRGLDRCDLDLALSAFHLDDPAFADAIRSKVTQSIDRHRDHYLGSIHYLTNETIRIDGDSASSESYTHGTLLFDRDGRLYHQQGGGRWLDRFAFRNGAWRISAPRKMILEWSRLDPVEEELTPVSQSVAGSLYTPARRDRQDASYDYLR